MNIITQGTNNTIIFTLEEKRTLTSPYYLVRMQSRSGKNIKRFILASNQTTAVNRYDEFTITESTTEVLTSGTVTLSPVGFWDYNVYEQLSSSNLNEALSDNPIPLETGLMLVRSQSGNSNTYYIEDNSENKFYGQ